ncbi:MAG: type II secretion system protein [Epsilonproteobacteria bacterium]|nr:type II secretion system protein [Campylobacterota bacterium]
MIHSEQNLPKHRAAFSMLTAVFTIVIMASLTAMIMNVTGKTIKETTQQYQKEQAMLLARSYTEQAILYATHYDRVGNANCVETIKSTFGDSANLYKITTNIQYIGNNDLIPVGCKGTQWATINNLGFDATISLIIDVYVEYKDFDHPLNLDADNTNDVFITFHRRTLQKL